jgi:hypothetical protein
MQAVGCSISWNPPKCHGEVARLAERPIARRRGVYDAVSHGETPRRRGQGLSVIVKTTGLVNHFYVYAVDEEFGPFFLKFCSYFPTTPGCA